LEALAIFGALALFAREIEFRDLALNKSPRLHYVGEPVVEFFVRGDFEKKLILDEPYLRPVPRFRRNQRR
jgi:hypothetical protein